MRRLSLEIKRPHLTAAILTLLGLGFGANYYAARFGPKSCAAIPEPTWRQVDTYLRLRSAPNVKLQRTADTRLPNSCIERFVVMDSQSNKSRVWFLSENRRYIFPSIVDLNHPPRLAMREKSIVVDVGELQRGSAPSLGPPNAPMTIVEFSDFQCPYCKRAAATLHQALLGKHKDDVHLIFRNYPLPFHAHARMAAELGACIAKQSNDAFWAYHDGVFEDQGRLSFPTFIEDSLGLLKRRFPSLNGSLVRSCMSSHQAARQVEADVQLGNKYEVSGTPTLFINNLRIGGVRDEAHLEEIIGRQGQLARN